MNATVFNISTPFCFIICQLILLVFFHKLFCSRWSKLQNAVRSWIKYQINKHSKMNQAWCSTKTPFFYLKKTLFCSISNRDSFISLLCFSNENFVISFSSQKRFSSLDWPMVIQYWKLERTLAWNENVLLAKKEYIL